MSSAVNILPAIESSSNGDLLNTGKVWCRYGIGRVVTNALSKESSSLLRSSVYHSVIRCHGHHTNLNTISSKSNLPFPKRQIVDSSKLKDFADNNLKVEEKWQKVHQTGRNHCGKRRN